MITDINNSALAEGWLEIPLDQLLLSLESGSRPKGGVREIETGIPSIGAEHLNERGGFRFEKIKYIPLEYYKKMTKGKIQLNDILIVKDGATTGKVSIIRDDFPYKEAAVNEHVFICRLVKIIEPLFIFNFLFSDDGQKRILSNFRGSAQGGIILSFAAGTMVCLAPQKEQTRITAKIEDLMPKINTVQGKLKNLSNIIERCRHSILTKAVSGELTKKWRESHIFDLNSKEYFDKVLGIQNYGKNNKSITDELYTIPENWIWTNAQNVCDPDRAITYGVIKLGKNEDSGVPILRSSNIRWLYIEDSNIKKILPNIANNYSRTYLKGGEVLVTVRGSLGGVAVVPKSMEGFNISREVALLPIKDNINPWYISFIIGSDWCQKWLLDKVKGVAYQGINIKDLKQLPVPLPPLGEQDEIVKRIEGLFKSITYVERGMNSSIRKTDQLAKILLSKAFKGKLVPTEAELAHKEKRVYETASELMKRVQRERRIEAIMSKEISVKASLTARKIEKEPKRPLIEVLSKASDEISPEELFKKAGFMENEIDEFYEELRQNILDGKIKELRPNKKDVYLKAI